MSKPWIAVDVDGVLADMVGSILPVLKERGHEITREQVSQWDFALGETTFGAIIDEMYHEREFVLGIKPIVGAVEGLRALRQKYQVAIVTSRPEHARDWTQDWLFAWGFECDALEFTGTGEKHTTGHDFEWLIDDYHVNVKAFLWNTNGKAVLFRQPWNHKHDLFAYHGRYSQAHNWRDVSCILLGEDLPAEAAERVRLSSETAFAVKSLRAQVPPEMHSVLSGGSEPLPEFDGNLVRYASGATRSADCEETRFDLISPEGLRRLAMRYALGAKKHGDRNWEGGMPASVVINHLESHLNKWKAGDKSDDNMAAVAWGAFAIMHYEQHHPECFDCGPNVWQGPDPEDVPLVASER